MSAVEARERVLVTGGAGFIGSAVVRHLIDNTESSVLTLDKLIYAGNLANLGDAANQERHRFERVDITDAGAVTDAFESFRPSAVMHLAAESHVDRSITGSADFISTNIIGTYVMLDVAYGYWSDLAAGAQIDFRFLLVSTDEIYGSLGPKDPPSEKSQYQPNSPYSASKASADHLVRARHKTYGFPDLTSNCTNNYGPYQYPEKLIPLRAAQESYPPCR